VSNYRIGLYNPKVENNSKLKDCSIIFDNLRDLEKHIRKDDEVVLVSGYSIYGYDDAELMKLIDDYNLNIYISDENGNNPVSSKALSKMKIHLIIATNEYIRGSIDIIKKFIE